MTIQDLTETVIERAQEVIDQFRLGRLSSVEIDLLEIAVDNLLKIGEQ